MSVYGKATHTNKYLSIDLHSSAQSKISGKNSHGLSQVPTAVPSSTKQRNSEEQRVVSDLKANGYPAKFIKMACKEKGRETRSKS